MEQFALGNKVRMVRKNKNLTQQQLAETCAITKSHVSKIENGQAVPALATLSKIAKALEVPLTWFMEEETATDLAIVRKTERVRKLGDKNIGYQYELLASKPLVSNLQPTIVTVLPEAEKVAPYQHDNEEFIYIITGAIYLRYGEDKILLEAGDSAYFSGKIPHIFLPANEQQAQVLMLYSDI